MLVTVVANLSMVDRDTFWTVLDNRSWMHPFDDKGRRRGYKDIPKSVRDLIDDPFRSLAGELRRAGGFAKDTTPFSEFLWADFLRRRIKRKLVELDFDRAIVAAMKLSKSQEAIYLPGWCGPVSPGMIGSRYRLVNFAQRVNVYKDRSIEEARCCLLAPRVICCIAATAVAIGGIADKG